MSTYHICTHCSFIMTNVRNVLTKHGHQNQCKRCLRLSTLVTVIHPHSPDCLPCYSFPEKHMMVWDCGHWTCGCSNCFIHKSSVLVGYVDCIQKPIKIPSRVKKYLRKLYIFMDIEHKEFTPLGKHNEKILLH